MKKNRSKIRNKRKSIISGLITGMLYTGVVILVSALSYMVAHLSEADLLVGAWLPFMLAGVALVFTSQIIKWSYRHRGHKQH